jgi:hypothetical protein
MSLARDVYHRTEYSGVSTEVQDAIPDSPVDDSVSFSLDRGVV